MKTKIDIDKFCDIFWSDFQKHVPEHLRPRLSIFHVREMINIFFDLINKYEPIRELKPEDIKDYKLTKLTHAGFAEILIKEIDARAERGFDTSAFIDIFNLFKQVPDIGTELDAAKDENEQLKQVITQVRNRTGKSRAPVFIFAAELEKWLKEKDRKSNMGFISITEVQNKIKELTGVNNNVIPAHLRDDAPYKQCDVCGRKTWSLDESVCKMTQPDGLSICSGTFLYEENKGAAR